MAHHGVQRRRSQPPHRVEEVTEDQLPDVGWVAGRDLALHAGSRGRAVTARGRGRGLLGRHLDGGVSQLESFDQVCEGVGPRSGLGQVVAFKNDRNLLVGPEFRDRRGGRGRGGGRAAPPAGGRGQREGESRRDTAGTA